MATLSLEVETFRRSTRTGETCCPTYRPAMWPTLERADTGPMRRTCFSKATSGKLLVSCDLGFHTDDVLRNLTRIRDLQNYESWYALKPRFVLNPQQELELVPIPDLTEEQYLRVTGIRGELLPLENENFQPGGPGGAVNLKFPYTISHCKEPPRLLRFSIANSSIDQSGSHSSRPEIHYTASRSALQSPKSLPKLPIKEAKPHLS